MYREYRFLKPSILFITLERLVASLLLVEHCNNLSLISRNTRISQINFRFPWRLEESANHYTLFSNCCNFMLFRALFGGLYVSTFFRWSKPEVLFNAHIVWGFSRMQLNIVKRSLVFDFESSKTLESRQGYDKVCNYCVYQFVLQPTYRGQHRFIQCTQTQSYRTNLDRVSAVFFV